MSTLSRPAIKIGSAVGAAGFIAAAALVRLLSRHDPDVARLMAAPFDDEPFTAEQRSAVEAARASVRRGEAIPFEDAFPSNSE